MKRDEERCKEEAVHGREVRRSAPTDIRFGPLSCNSYYILIERGLQGGDKGL
jgi:hypothetical protein